MYLNKWKLLFLFICVVFNWFFGRFIKIFVVINIVIGILIYILINMMDIFVSKVFVKNGIGLVIIF